jgi:tyrosyl-tRNA synthetase
MLDLFEDLKWRGLIHDIMPDTEALFTKETVGVYAGFDPTSDSLHIGNLVPIILLKHVQLHGHRPIALVGGATGMVGDPSGKNAERNLLDIPTLRYNEDCIKKQLSQFLNFSLEIKNPAEIVNNYDWFQNFNFLDFIRDVGKHITVNYMLAKDSVQKRLESGMSFTEFSYQLIQGYDFYHLWKSKNVKVQAAGSDQWGNIVAGTELIRRIGGGEGFAFTAPLITKADGSKFGKSESGNVWLDKTKTTPFEFYQFWINTGDDDAAKYIKIFTFLNKNIIEQEIENHQNNPAERKLQKRLAQEVTLLVHGEEELEAAIATTTKLFAANTIEGLLTLNEEEFLSVFNGVPQHLGSLESIESEDTFTNILTSTGIFPSKTEARKMIEGGGVSINKSKISTDHQKANHTQLLHGKYILVQKGKNKNFLITFS